MGMEAGVADELSYQVIRSQRRQRVALQIRDGQLQVLAPMQAPPEVLSQLVRQKRRWIEKHLATVAQVPMTNHIDAGILPLLDDRLALKVVDDQITAVSRDGWQLWVQLSHRIKPDNRRAQLIQQLSNWYQQEAQLWFETETLLWARQLGTTVKAVRIKNFRRQWGTCERHGVISYNWRLMLAPTWVARYVVVHELIHRFEMNHSPAYWQRVAAAYPNYQQARDWLKQHQHVLDLC